MANVCSIMDGTGRVVGTYRKTHLPNAVDEDYSEAGVLEAGRSLEPIQTSLGRIGCLICYDICFPEAAMCYALAGAEILLHPSVGYAFPDEEESTAEARLRARASDAQVPLLYANFGHEARRPPSRSCVIDASGTVVANAGNASEVVVFADVEVGGVRLRDWSWKGYDHRRWLAAKRRPDLYGLLVKGVPPLLAGWVPPRPVSRSDPGA